MTVGDLLARMSASEFHEWFVFYQMEPFGEWRSDLRAGIVASTFASAHRRKGSRRPTPKDFMPTFGEKEESRQSWQEQLRIVQFADIGFQKLFAEDSNG